MLTAKWFEIPDSAWLQRAACGKRNCCPEMAAAKYVPGDGPMYVMRSGMTFDAVREEWHLSKRAADQWQKFKSAGGNWKDFHPEGAHFVRSELRLNALALDPSVRRRLEREGIPGAHNMQSIPLPVESLPVRVKCPMCGWINLLGPIAETP